MYIDLETGVRVSEADMQNYAAQEGLDIEEYISLMGYTLESDNNTSESADTSSADLLDPTTFQKDAAAGADVVSQPMTASQAEYVEPEDTELPSVDTSLDSPDPEPNPFSEKYLEFSSGYDKNKKSRIYEGDYAQNYAGQTWNKNNRSGTYPDSFEEFAKQFNTELRQDNFEELDEVVIKAKTSDFVRDSKKKAEELVELRDEVTEVSQKTNIGLDYFKLEEKNGELIPRVERKTSTKDTGNGRESGASGDLGYFLNDYETDLKDSLGPEKYKKYKLLQTNLDVYNSLLAQSGNQPEVLSKNNLKELFNLEEIDSDTKTNVVNAKKLEETEIFLRNVSPKVKREMNRFLPMSERAREEVEKIRQKRITDAEDYKAKYGVTLVREETIGGRTYTPPDTGILDDKGYEEVFADEEKRLTIDKSVLESDVKNFITEQTNLEKESASYKANLLDLSNRIKEIDSYAIPSVDLEKQRNELVLKYNSILKEDGFQNLVTVNKKLINDQQSLQNRIQNISKNTNDFIEGSAISKTLLKSYELSDKFSQVMEESFLGTSSMLGASLLKGTGDIAMALTEDSKLGDLLNEGDWYDNLVNLKGAAINYNQRLAKRREKYLPANLKSSDSSSTMQYIGDMLVNNSPSILVALGTMGGGSLSSAAGGIVNMRTGAMLSGAARAQASRSLTNTATGIFFTMEAGGKMSELEIGQKEAQGNINKLKVDLANAVGTVEREEILSQIQDQTDLLNLSQLKKSFSSIMYGGIASFAERTGTLGFMNNFSKLSTNMSQKLISKYGFEGINKAVAKSVGALGTTGIGAGVELLEEGLTLVGQNIVDNTILGQDKSLIEGLDGEFVRNTFATSLAISGPQASQNIHAAISSEIKTNAENKKETELRNELIEIQNQLNEVDPTTGKTIDGRTKAGKALIDRKKAIIKESALLNAEIVGKMANMSAEDIEAVFENNRIMRSKRREAAELGNAFNVSKYAQKRLKTLTDEYKILQKENETTLGKNRKEFEAFFKEAINTPQSVYNAELYEFSKNIAKSVDGVKVLEFASNESGDGRKRFEEYLKNEVKLGNLSQENSDKALEGYDNGSNAANIGNNLLIFRDNAMKTFTLDGSLEGSIAAISPMHELGHIQTRKAGIIKDDAVVGDAKIMVDGILAYVKERFNSKSLSKENYDIFNERIKAYKDTEKYTATRGIDADELIQLVSDFTALGILPKSSFNQLTGTKMFVNSLLKKLNGDASMFFRMDSSSDVFNFISSWQNKAFSFELAGAEDEDDTLKESKQLTPEQDTQLRSDVAEIKEEASKGKALAKQFNKDFVKGAKQTRLENKVLQEIKPVVDRVVTNRTKALYDPIAEDAKKNVSRQMFQESMRSDIESMVFDEFTGKQDLEKFIVNRAFLRANNLAERLGIKSVEEGITKGLEAAEKVAIEETSAPKADRPKYRNILKSNTLPTETVNTIKDKVLKTIRTLKSKLDAKVSINKTVTPLIAEIKKNMGKQADIDFKKAMGGKKDAQLRRFLIKNKRVVLENMTTTWLMGAMPGAVQKQVNGSFTSDWQGKKIDREKTSTQQAGRTSGAEIVRRLPNAFKNLDDKTYLSYIIDESGAPIRGRKESLAKAMAEELSFDIFTTELQNENSDIRKAFEGNQEALGVALTDNFVQEVTRDAERGTVKFSKTLNNLKRVNFFVEEMNTSKFKQTLLTTRNLNKAIKIHFKDDFTAVELRGIAKEVAKNNLVKNFEFQIEKVGIEKAIDMVVDFAGEVLFTPSEYKTIMAKYGLESNYNLRSLQAVNEGRLAASWLKDNMKEPRFVRGFYRALSGPARLAGFELKTDPDGIIVLDSNVKKEVKSARNGLFNSVKDINKALDIKSTKGIFRNTEQTRKNWWFSKNFNKLDEQGKKDYLKKLYEEGQLDKEIMLEAMELLREGYANGDISLTGVQMLWVGQFADMTGVGKAAGAPRMIPVIPMPDGSFKVATDADLVKAGLAYSKDPYVLEHMIPAKEIATLSLQYILSGDAKIKKELIKKLENYDTSILPKKLDDKLKKERGTQEMMGIDFKTGDSPVDTRYDGLGIMFYDAKTGTFVGSPVKYSKPELTKVKTEQKAIDNARSIKWSKSTKKIRVFDFDDTLARTKSNVLYTMPGEVRVFHGGDIKSVKDIDGFVYFSEDQKQAAAYAKGNQGEVSSFKIDETSIATEDQVFDVINNLGIKPRAGYAVDESSLYELIDPRFEQSFSKKDLEKLAAALKRKGIKAARFTDTNISQGKNEGRETENIVVFDKKTVQEQSKLTAAEFAAKSDEMAAKGADFDFIEFSKVMNGQEGPLLKVAKIIAEKRGTDDLFVLTARPQDAAGPIQDFLAELGLDIPLENITGLADGNPKAKADWMIGKVSEGYNDFYFADDHLGNVKAVKDVFNTFDVKGKVQQAKIKFSQGLDKGFNDMIERQTGTESFKEFSKGVAQRRGKKVGKFKFFVSPSAEDFRGLTQYKFAGKGKQGEADQKFFEEALMNPYFKGVAAVESAREVIKNDTKALFKIFKPVKKKLNKLVPGIDFTYDGAVRVFLWNKAGIEIPGLTKRDNKKLNDIVANDPELSAFADALLLVSKQDTWPAPTEYWEAKTTLSDLNTLTEKTNRKEYLKEFIENVDIIFSEKNLNKVEALYGKASRTAIENAIYAMKTGSNSPNQSGDVITNRWLKWVNNSIGTIMFFNRRSALLQLTSATNFLNWSDNNPAKAALAFANQPQYWKDWAMIFNSDKLKQRRSGLKSDVQESEIANAAKNTEDKIGSIIAYLLKIGFSPTQIADSIAISSGGATFYRNRVNSLKKQGLSEAEAEAQAFKDFSKLSDEAQQSGDPALVSQQQRSVAGRLILSFQNTTMQYTRLMKKAGQDLVNRRGDPKTHISKILYYGALQNFIFNALSQTAFALIPGFDEEEDEDEVKRDEKLEKKASKVLNGMMDSVIRGTGIYGAIVTNIKNTYNTWKTEADKGFKGDQAKTLLEAANISPAIGSKLRKIYSAIQAYKFDKAVMEKHPWSVTIDGKFNPSATYNVIGSLASASLNLPLDRALAEARGVAEMFDNRNSEMQRIALALGWRTWNVGAKNEEFDLIKMEAKQAKKDKKAKEKQDYKDYLQRVFDKLSYEETQEYFTNKGAAAKKEWILKIGKEKGIN